MNTQPRLVEVRRNVLKQNDLLAAELRRQFADAGVFVNWTGCPISDFANC